MKGHDWALKWRAKGNWVLILAGISLLFPYSASVLCISSAGHVAIEDLNAPCCKSAGMNKAGESRPGTLSTTGLDCANCTDLFMTPYGRGAVLGSQVVDTPSPLAWIYSGPHLSPDIPSLQSHLDTPENNAPEPAPPQVLLRC